MTDREHQRIPYAVEVYYRTASAFLLAYSFNLSRGGLFLETELAAEVGNELELRFAVPGAGPITVVGVVAWKRGRESLEGPPGLGVEFHDVASSLGVVIDHLVAGYQGITLFLMSGDRQDRSNLARSMRSIVTTAEIIQAASIQVATNVLNSELDLAVIDLDFDEEAGLMALRAAKAVTPPIPTIALASSKKLRDRARAAGADELCSNPPPFAEFQLAILRALGRPLTVRG